MTFNFRSLERGTLHSFFFDNPDDISESSKIILVLDYLSVPQKINLLGHSRNRNIPYYHYGYLASRINLLLGLGYATSSKTYIGQVDSSALPEFCGCPFAYGVVKSKHPLSKNKDFLNTYNMHKDINPHFISYEVEYPTLSS